MCIIAIVPAGARITRRTFRHCASENPDGIGIAVADGRTVKVWKYLDAPRRAWRALQAAQTPDRRAPVLVHFRLGTSGARDVGNVHPFPLPDGSYVAHNGVLSGYGGDVASDTADFCAAVLRRLSGDWLKSARVIEVVEGLTLGSRLAAVTPKGGVVTTGHGWQTCDETGVTYSNGGFRPWRSSLFGRDWPYCDADMDDADLDDAVTAHTWDGRQAYCLMCVTPVEAEYYGLTPVDSRYRGCCEDCGDRIGPSRPERVRDILGDQWSLAGL